MERPVGKGAGIPVELPKGVHPVEYLASFAPAIRNQKANEALQGCWDSIRQAEICMHEPLGLFACLTAEEEAAAFLYHTLKAKGYPIADYGKLQDHGNKVRVFLLGVALVAYFFRANLASEGLRVRVERDGKMPKITCYIPFNSYVASFDDIFETVVTVGEGEEGFKRAIREAVEAAMTSATTEHQSVRSGIDYLKNRRNRCLYGPLKKKYALKDRSELMQYTSNCVSLLVCGLLIQFNHNKNETLGRVLAAFFDQLKLSENPQAE